MGAGSAVPPRSGDASTLQQDVSKASAVFDLVSQPDLTERIISYCEPRTIRMLRNVSRAWRNRTNSELPLHAVIKRLYIHAPPGDLPILVFKTDRSEFNSLLPTSRAFLARVNDDLPTHIIYRTPNHIHTTECGAALIIVPGRRLR